MESVVFRSKYSSRIAPGEIRGEIRGCSECKVSKEGFIPARKQIEKVLANGLRLELYRRAMYHGYDNATDDSEASPTQDPDFLPSVDIPAIESEQAARIEAQSLAESPASAPEDLNKKDEGAMPEDSATNSEPSAKV